MSNDAGLIEKLEAIATNQIDSRVMAIPLDEAISIARQHTCAGAGKGVVDATEVERVAKAIFNVGRDKNFDETGEELLTFEEARDSTDVDERYAYDCAIDEAKAAIAALAQGKVSV